MTDSNKFEAAYFLPPIEIDEDQLVYQTWRPVLLAGLAMLIASCIANNPALFNLLFMICPIIGLTAMLFASWGLAIFAVRRLNLIVGKPLNPSAVAAIGASFAFIFVATACAALIIAINPVGEVEAPTIPTSVIALVGSLLVQVVARVSVRRAIARHNMRAGRRPFKEPPCDLRFQISQMMILTVVISVLLALAMHLAGEELIIGVTALCILTAIAFFPAIVIAKWVQSKMGEVQLKPWEDVRTIDWETELAAAEAQRVENTSPANHSALSESAANSQPLPQASPSDRLPPYRSATRFTQYEALTTAARWVSVAGGFFCVLFVVSLEISQSIQGVGSQFDGLIFALPLGFSGLLIGFFMAFLTMMVPLLLNLATGDRVRTGTIAAFGGSIVGALGSMIVLSTFEMVHFQLPYDTALDCFAENNRFPLAMMLLASLMGQTFARLGVKCCGHENRLTNEDCRDESSGPTWSRYSIIASIFAASAWALVIACNDVTATNSLTINEHLLSFFLIVLACMATVWPLANFFTRLVKLELKAVNRPLFSWFLLGSKMKAPF